MTAGRDDAFLWDGDDDPTLVTGASDAPDESEPAPRVHKPLRDPADVPAPEPVALPHGYDAVGRGAGEVGRIESDGTVTPAVVAQPLGNAALIGIGILSGIYLLWTAGWVVGGLRLQGTAQFLVAPLGYQISLWLAILGPALWFLSTLVLTRGSRTWLRVIGLVIGAILLVPWPFLMVGAIGQ